MKVFLLDLWLDLREKRLAPVAVLLLAGIIAVPIALSKKSEPAPPPPTATTAAAPVGPVVESQADASSVDSKLQTFSARDPFEPTGHVATAPTTAPTTSGTGGGSGTGTSTTPTSTGGGAPTGNGPTTTPGSGNTGNTTPETKTTLFTYTVDVRFGTGGDVQPYKGVQRLQLIPDNNNPKLVFLGVTTTGKTAVFLVDSNTGVDTPGGKCRPSADQCTFLYLRPDSNHDQAVLTASDGTVYHVRLLGINRVSVSSATGQPNSNSGNSGSNTNSNRTPAFTGTAKKQSSNGTTTDQAGTNPPGEPTTPSSFQQLFADSGN
jgi:hypothetical protein